MPDPNSDTRKTSPKGRLKRMKWFTLYAPVKGIEEIDRLALTNMHPLPHLGLLGSAICSEGAQDSPGWE